LHLEPVFPKADTYGADAYITFIANEETLRGVSGLPFTSSRGKCVEEEKS